MFAFVFASRETPINRVADALDIRPNVVTGIVQRLVERGLVERREDTTDRRVRFLTVTEKGISLIGELAGIIAAKERLLLERLNDRQLHQLRDLLAAMQSPQRD